MIKKILIIVGVIVLGVMIYYGRYFVFDNEVNETPIVVEQTQQETVTTKEGSFTEVDRIHKGSGKATLTKKGEERILRFENFQVTNGPDLYVWLINTENPTTKIESLGNYISLGRLKGNVGDQNYVFNSKDFPNVNLDEYDTVVIWCKQFSQLFSFANLK